MSLLNTVCRVCLTMDVPMRIIAGSPLQDIYEKLTAIPWTAALRPAAVCYICCAQLRKSHNLMVRSLRADRVFAQMLLNDDTVNGESMTMLNQAAYGHALLITPVELIDIAGTELNLVKTEIKEEPLLSQYDDGMEMNRLAEAGYLTVDESKDGEDTESELENVYIESQVLIDGGDIKEETLDPLDNSTPVEYIHTKEITDGEDTDSKDAEDMIENQTEGAAPASKCQQTLAETVQDGNTLILGGKNMEEPRTCRTVVEYPASRNIGRYVLRRNTGSVNHVQRSINTPISSGTGNVRVDGVVNTSSKHMRRMFVCDHCGNMFDDKYLLIEHIECHVNVKKTSYRNGLPQRTLLRKEKFSRTGTFVNKHTKTRSEKKLVQCDICQRRFTTKSILNRHLLTHAGIKPFECEICKVKFSQNGNLRRHIRVHTKEKPYECEICKRRFSTKSSLKKHFRTHTNAHKEKPYECEICKGRFSEKDTLKKHLRVHTKEKPYECEICKVRFSRNDNLKTHLRFHTKEKPYECEICKARFSYRSSLSKHLKVHTKEKPYKCEICKVKFTQKNYLKEHLNVHTKEKRVRI